MGEGGWGLIVNTYVHCTHSAVIKCSQFIENDTFRTERLVHCKQLRDSDHDAVFFFLLRAVFTVAARSLVCSTFFFSIGPWSQL